MKLSKNLTFAEAVKSQTAIKNKIDNQPNFRQLSIMVKLANELFQPIRDHFDSPIYVSSFFRSKELNKKIGGASKSDHMILDDVAAIDLDGDVYGNPSNADIFWYVLKYHKFNKLIWEFGDYSNPDWVHISWSIDPKKNESKNVLHAYRKWGKTVYERFNPKNFRGT